ncbi:nuclear transport factor 2 (NTF2) family protein / RNA recognition motif (RRM)-containing protein [Striga hermonthica]|uniref:Ninja-family protein n=1 Tax=Striga hermonthica TaxID=68872 RepID=A0A9N7R7F2_STRHE|nr:nuclear transport factor 2 (NTF2) family protein / RNA recognition motif (RRM)-containing protein [Striga hermonthica]
MGEEFAVSEVVKKEGGGGGGEKKGGEFELSLELSIGLGKYGKSENAGEISEDPNDGNNNKNNNDYCFGSRRSDFSIDGDVDLQRRREIQALRRLEARKKRKEKLDKSRRIGFFDKNESLPEAQKSGARMREQRGKGKKAALSEQKIRGKEKNNELSLSLFTENKNVVLGVGDRLLYPKVQRLDPLRRAGEGEAAVSNKSLEQSSSVVSDYQSTSNKGGSTSDTGSHSSTPGGLHHRTTKTELNPHLSIESNGSSCQAGLGPHLAVGNSSCGPIPQGLKPNTHVGQTHATTTTCSTSKNSVPIRPEQTSGDGGLGIRPVRHMPCVSTMGNGPNGRMVIGFLYKYTKSEVAIVCACHRSSFSPAEFVEHAGGVGVSHPMRHITMHPGFGL